MGRFVWIGRILILLPVLFTSCGVYDSLRTWGERDRRERIKDLSSGELEQWKRDLEISGDHIRELHSSIQKLVQESAHRGNVSWKIARAFMEKGRFRMAESYFKDAVDGRLVDYTGKPLPEDSYFEKSLPFFRIALQRNLPDRELLFDAGLCYANSSRELGWEADRWETAVFLFETMHRMNPDDVRSLYQLALLYGKTEDESRRDIPRAEEYLEQLLRKKPEDVASRFALAHLKVSTGDLEGGRREYLKILDTLQELHDSGSVPGKYEKNSMVKKARENLEKLATCIEGRPGCEILILE